MTSMTLHDWIALITITALILGSILATWINVRERLVRIETRINGMPERLGRLENKVTRLSSDVENHLKST